MLRVMEQSNAEKGGQVARQGVRWGRGAAGPRPAGRAGAAPEAAVRRCLLQSASVARASCSCTAAVPPCSPEPLRAGWAADSSDCSSELAESTLPLLRLPLRLIMCSGLRGPKRGGAAAAAVTAMLGF